MNNTKIIVDSQLRISGLPSELEQQFIRANIFDNPKFATLERLGKWTGNTDEYIELWSHQERLYDAA
jgi:hypothetical protein